MMSAFGETAEYLVKVLLGSTGLGVGAVQPVHDKNPQPPLRFPRLPVHPSAERLL